jgi:hypothetical protein
MCYKSWRGSVKQYHNNYYRIKRMDALFKSLFPGTEYRSKKELERLEQKGETDQ